MVRDPKVRFSDRADDYRKYRPSYPVEALKFAKDHCHAREDWQIADVGSGTGISTEALLRVFGCSVHAVEPNASMRAQAERLLGRNPRFHSVDGSSECTSLPDASVDMVAAFQAFHWFDKDKTSVEFARILRMPCWVLLVWNDRVTEGTAFLEGYETILKDLPEYPKVTHKSINAEDVRTFLGNTDLTVAEFPSSQRFDLDGLLGRSFSSSYSPAKDTDGYRRHVERLTALFDQTNKNGHVEFVYVTKVYIGKLA
jgi:SAM-dependent methyltransferase